MSDRRRRRYLICYDIADRKRLARVHRLLKAWALPVQYSVFMATLPPQAFEALMTRLKEIIDPSRDDIRAYRLTSLSDVTWLGVQLLPEDLLVRDGEKDLLLRDTVNLQSD